MDIKKIKQYITNSKKQFIRSLFVGISSVVIDLALLILLKEILHIKAFISVAINQIFVILYNFTMNKYWAFETKHNSLKQFVRYIVLVSFNYSASIFFMYVFNEILQIDYKIVRLFTIALFFIINFILYKHWVYKEKII